MGIYYTTLIGTYITSLLSRMADSKKYKLMAVFWIIFAAGILVVFTGFREGIGDTGMYMHTYRLLVQNPDPTISGKDFGFTIFNLILIQFSTNPQTLVFVVALITQVCNIYVFHKYRSAIELQIFMYIASGYVTVTMNGMRQCMAAALLFLTTPLIIKGDFKKYLFFTLLIATIHESALFMIPIYFIVKIKPWSKKFYLMIGAACVGVVFYDVLSPYIFKALESTSYGEYSQFDEGGSSFLRVIVNMVPVILAYLKKDELKRVWPESDIFINMAVLNCIFVGFGMANWIFNRFTLYLQLYNFILLPYVIKNCLRGKERRLIYLGLIGCYFIFFYYEQVIQLNLIYKSVL